MEVRKGKNVITQATRTHIIYFLSRMGRTEHPHLIRVHHFNRNGVYLRDVKRWLSNFRGEDMPNSFTWSYKRSYKTGFVWQDLVEDEPLTPTRDDENEYVLKGSEIVSHVSLSDVCVCCGGKNAYSEKSTTTTSTEESMKVNARKPPEKDKKKRVEVREPLTAYPVPAATFSETQSRRQSSAATSNLLTSCAEVDTNDSALIMESDWVNRASKNPSMNETEITGGSPRVLGSAWNQQNSRKRFRTGSNISNGRQCGKTFKPDKLHSHMMMMMMSPKGMKSSRNGGGGGVASTMAPKVRLPWK